MMLLLGHPGLGAQNADIYNINGLDIEKPTLPMVLARPCGVRTREPENHQNLDPFLEPSFLPLGAEKK